MRIIARLPHIDLWCLRAEHADKERTLKIKYKNMHRSMF